MPLDPPPFNAPIVRPQAGTLTPDWTRWLLELWETVTAQPNILGTKISLTGQHASIPLTPLPVPSLTGGFYRVSWYLHITTVDPVSASVGLTINWTENGLPRSITATTVNQTTPGLSNGGSTLIAADQATPVTFSTTYVSNTPGTMQYSLGLVLEQL